MPRSSHHPAISTCRAGGFTLLELLAVIAIIAILAAILIPTTGAVRNSARNAQTKIQLQQWAAAVEAFRQEYGFYPQLQAISERSPTSLSNAPVAIRFFEAMAGRRINGGRLQPDDPGFLAGNRRSIPFLALADAEVEVSGSTVLFRDAHGNNAIYVLFDRNGDGVIRVGSGNDPDYDGAVNFTTATGAVMPFSFPNEGVRAGVVFLSPGRARTASDIITSW